MKLSNREIEEHYFIEFFRDVSLPAGNIKFSDMPDLVVYSPSTGERILGIEQTRYYIQDGDVNSCEQKQSFLRRKVLEQAEAKYRSGSSGNLRLSLGFNPDHPINSLNSVVERLVTLTTQIDRKDSGSLLRSRFATIPELDFVFVQWDMDVPWQLTQVHSVSISSRDRLQAIIKEKDRLAAKYKPCREMWLLVVIDFFDPAQDQEIDNSIVSLESEKFSKIILYKTVFNMVHEIRCYKATSELENDSPYGEQVANNGEHVLQIRD